MSGRTEGKRVRWTHILWTAGFSTGDSGFKTGQPNELVQTVKFYRAVTDSSTQ